MIAAIGWGIMICEDGHIHIELIAKDDRPFAELTLECTDDIKQFTQDLTDAIERLRKRELN